MLSAQTAAYVSAQILQEKAEMWSDVHILISSSNVAWKSMCAKIYNLTLIYDSEAWHQRLDILLSSHLVWLDAVKGKVGLFIGSPGQSREVGSSQGPRSRHLPNSCRTAHWGGVGRGDSVVSLWRWWTWMSPFCLLKGLVLCPWPEALCLAQNVLFSTEGANGEPGG